jgi:hypothetical protein
MKGKKFLLLVFFTFLINSISIIAFSEQVIKELPTAIAINPKPIPMPMIFEMCVPRPETFISPKYALICIVNKSGKDIDYQYKWGVSYDWEERKISVDDMQLYRYELSNDRANSPKFEIKFNSDEVIELRKYVSHNQDCDFGKKYFFRINKNKLFISEE